MTTKQISTMYPFVYRGGFENREDGDGVEAHKGPRKGQLFSFVSSISCVFLGVTKLKVQRVGATYHGANSDGAGFGVVLHYQIHPGNYNWGHSGADSEDVV